MKSNGLVRLLSASIAILMNVSGTSAQERQNGAEGGDPSWISLISAAPKNWMYDFVRLRAYAAVARAVGEERDARPGIFIVGGEPANPGDNPFQVALLNKNVTDNFQAQFCGGTLLKPDTVVTAAHCSDFIISEQVAVLTGTQKLDGSGVRRRVANIAVHPQWNPQTFAYDVAVWKLSAEAEDQPVAFLSSDDGSVGTTYLATGWGALAEDGSFPLDLRKVEIPQISRADCNDGNSYNGNVTEQMLCAGFTLGGRDTCQGDSGGPLALNGELVGITSWGVGCARPDLPGVYTRISDAQVRNFIEQND